MCRLQPTLFITLSVFELFKVLPTTLLVLQELSLEQDVWMSILLDVGIGLEINVLTSKFILLGYQMLGEMGCHPEICFYLKNNDAS